MNCPYNENKERSSMKKIFVLLTAGILLFSFPLFAREEAQPLALNPAENRIEGPGLPFEFAFEPGKLSEARTGRIFTLGANAPDFTLPSLQEEPVPIRYPRWAVREGWEGTLVIAVEILVSGKVGRMQVMESTGYPLLDESAAEAVRQWHFHPATEKGRPVTSCIQIPILFRIEAKP